jgi:hypothetical protein
MTALARLTGEFAALLTPAQANDDKLTQWIATVRTAGLPHLHSFCNGLELDRAAVNAGLTLPHHNGRTEGVNTRTKKIMRQMHGRAGFDRLQVISVWMAWTMVPMRRVENLARLSSRQDFSCAKARSPGALSRACARLNSW